MTSESIYRNLSVENTSWTLDKLANNIHIITKPKFQRDKKWTPLPMNDSKKPKPSYKKYIDFLVSNKNSVFPISLGTEIHDGQEKYIVIDGNNRINAIITFLNNPYSIYPEYYVDVFIMIDNDSISLEEKIIIKTFIRNLTYKSLSTFRRLNNIIPDDVNIPMGLFCKIEDELIQIQTKLLINNADSYATNIALNINIFKNGNYEIYCKIFEEINKYANTLSENELLSAILFNTEIHIEDPELKHQLLTEIHEFYEKRGTDEVLQQYKITDVNYFKINAFDFIISLQNYCSKLYYVIPEFESEGLSLLFKLYKIMFKTIEPQSFTPANVNDFCQKILYACDVLDKSYDLIFPKNIDESLFNSTSVRKNTLLKKNSLYILLSTIIACKDIYSKSALIPNIRICITYHLLSNTKYLTSISEEEKGAYKSYDMIEYQAGGGYIDNLCKNILYKDSEHDMVFKNIHSDKLKELIIIVLNSQKKEISYKDKTSKNKRRKLNLVDKILLCSYWNRNIPNLYIQRLYSLEHITPFSSQWSNDIKLDIDRLGNLFPTFDEINKKRGNKSLEIYYHNDYIHFTNSIRRLLPENYSEINTFSDRKTSITNTALFNDYCNINENIYIHNLVDDLYVSSSNV
jgi:hypothetical protein